MRSGDRAEVGCRVFVVQHGEKERVPGDPGLTETGRAQARVTGEWLRSAHAVTHVVTSPLRRAVETAEPIAGVFGLEATTDDRLRERMNWEGGDGQTLDQFLAEWRRTSADRSFKPAVGDSSHEAADRFLAALDDVAVAAGARGQAVAVAHGGVTVDALRTVLGDTEVMAQRPTLVDDGVASCAITVFQHTDGGWAVDLPSTAHLGG